MASDSSNTPPVDQYLPNEPTVTTEKNTDPTTPSDHNSLTPSIVLHDDDRLPYDDRFPDDDRFSYDDDSALNISEAEAEAEEEEEEEEEAEAEEAEVLNNTTENGDADVLPPALKKLLDDHLPARVKEAMVQALTTSKEYSDPLVAKFNELVPPHVKEKLMAGVDSTGEFLSNPYVKKAMLVSMVLPWLVYGGGVGSGLFAVRMMKAPGAGGLMIPRLLFEKNPRMYFKLLKFARGFW